MADNTSNLSEETRERIKAVLLHRASQFPRDDLVAKLISADKCYHLANLRADDNDNNQTDSYSRYQELDNALVREVAEAYDIFYHEVFLGSNKIFTMTSSAEQKEVAQQFNAILANQSRKMNWPLNLQKMFTDLSKYNLGATEVSWETTYAYSPAIQLEGGKRTRTSRENRVAWAGNMIRHLDPYNILFDTRVPSSQLAEDGEWAGVITYLSQVALFKLINTLTLDANTQVYTSRTGDPTFDVYNLSTASVAAGHNLDYRTPKIVPLGGTPVPTASDNWFSFFGGQTNALGTKDDYTVAEIYLRIVPASYGMSGKDVQLWKFWLLDGTWILASKLISNAHDLLPILLAQTDEDSLGINSAGPAQIAIPYQKTAKQLMDRVFAGADRAIRDRGIYDPRYLDESVVNSVIPDAKMPIKTALPAGRTLDQVYRQLPMGSDTTGLRQDSMMTHELGLRACGINNSGVGQFTKGNRTLEEYNDVQANAQGRLIKRATQLENSYMSKLKRIIKLNILEKQDDESVFDTEARQQLDVDASELFEAEVEFEMADALKPTEYMLSSNVLQQLFSLMQTMPDAFQEYDIPSAVGHILSQSMGINMEQYKYTEEQLAQMRAAAAAAAAAAQGTQGTQGA